MKRRQAIEPIIGHLKHDGWLGRNYLKGTAGDRVNVLLSCSGHNLRLILKRLRDSCARIFCRAILAWIVRLRKAFLEANTDCSTLSVA